MLIIFVIYKPQKCCIESTLNKLWICELKLKEKTKCNKKNLFQNTFFAKIEIIFFNSGRYFSDFIILHDAKENNSGHYHHR